MRSILALLAATSLTLSANAWAGCEAPYDTGALLGDLVMIEDAVRKNDGPTALTVANKMEAGFACLNEAMPYMIVSRAYRAVGAGKLLGGDDARGRAWWLTAIGIDPGFEYGLEDMPADNPLRFTFEGLREEGEASPETVKDVTFVAETNWVDGSLVGSPRATVGRPHVFQSRTGDAVSTWVIEGNAFPAAAVQAVAPPEPVAAVTTGKAPKERAPRAEPEPRPEREPKAEKEPKPEKERKAKDPSKAKDDGGFYQRKRPKEKTPLMIIGGATMLGAGGLYYWSSVTRKGFDESETREDMDKFKRATNNLVIASGAVLAVGAGVLTWGIILDDTGRPLPGINIRF